LHLELSEERLPGDVDFVPLILQCAQAPVIHLAQITDGMGTADQRMNFLFRWRGTFNRSENHLKFLNNQTFHFQKLIFGFGVKFFGACRVQVMVELFPALEMVFYLKLPFWVAILVGPEQPVG